jgi:hypothetical protein
MIWHLLQLKQEWRSFFLCTLVKKGKSVQCIALLGRQILGHLTTCGRSTHISKLIEE